MNRKILTQGHFDGFCLLYSIMNAFKTLVSPNQSAVNFTNNNLRKWQKLISISPSLQNFASGEGSDFGVDRNITDINLTERFISDSFTVLTEGLKIRIWSSRIALDKLFETDFSESAIILSVNEKANLEYGAVGDHWITLVGVDGANSRFLVCCSYTHHSKGDTERFDKISERTYNNTIDFKELNKNRIYLNSIQKVSIKRT